MCTEKQDENYNQENVTDTNGIRNKLRLVLAEANTKTQAYINDVCSFFWGGVSF
jgi:hypothetical protein